MKTGEKVSNSSSYKQGCVSIDLDGIKEYRQFYGYSLDAISECKIWERGISRIASFIEETGIKVTFFVITENINQPVVREALRYFASKGHELASHTHTHPYPFCRLSDQGIYSEIDRSKKTLEDAFGQKVAGFRAPAYDLDGRVLDALEKLDFEYDSSIMPTVLNPLIVLISRIKSGWTTESPFHFSQMFAPVHAYFPSVDSHVSSRRPSRNILEIPISVLPYVRYPFYPTFLNATGMIGLRFIFALAKLLPYFNFEMHTIDFLGSKDIYDIPELSAHPGIYYPANIKIAYYQWIIEKMGETFTWELLVSIAKAQKEILRPTMKV